MDSPEVPSYSVPRKFGSHPGRRDPSLALAVPSLPCLRASFLHGPSHSKRSRTPPDHETQAKHPAARPLACHTITPSAHQLTRRGLTGHFTSMAIIQWCSEGCGKWPTTAQPSEHTHPRSSHFTLFRGTPRLTVDLERASGLRGAFQRTLIPAADDSGSPSIRRTRYSIGLILDVRLLTVRYCFIAPHPEIHNKQNPCSCRLTPHRLGRSAVT